MASRGTFPIQSPNRGEMEISGSFATLNGNGTIITIKGSGFTVDDKAAAGTYVITFDDTFPTFLGAEATLQLNTADNWFCQVVSFASATKKLTIKVVDGTTAAAADVADHANNRVNFKAKFLNVT